MTNWKKTSEELPECDCGDRVVGIARYSVPYNDGFGDLRAHRPARPHVIVLVAMEDGFRDVEDRGLDICDCEWWALECDLLRSMGYV